MIEPVSPDAPDLAGRVLMSQDWRDLTFLHWAVDPAWWRTGCLRGCVPTPSRGARTSAWSRSGWSTPGSAAAPPCRGRDLPRDQRAALLRRRHRSARHRLPQPRHRPRGRGRRRPRRLRRALPLGADALPRAGDEHPYDARLRWPGTRREPRRRTCRGEREPTDLDHFLSARWGLHTRWGGRTLYVPNRHDPGRVHDAEVLALEDGLMASVGLARPGRPAPRPRRVQPRRPHGLRVPRRRPSPA